MLRSPRGSTAVPDASAGSIADHLKYYRTQREELERGLLPLATSVDGRRFSLQASLHRLALQAGGYVVIEGDGPPCLGQLLTLRPDSMAVSDFRPGASGTIQVRGARGEGVVLDGSGETFHDALARPATPDEVEAWTVRVR